MTELPPILSGSAQQQIAALRDYLVRLSQSLDTAETAVQTINSGAAVSSGSAAGLTAAGNRDSAAVNELRALITKTATTVKHQVDMLSQSLHEDYMAKSDFGEYTEQIDALFTATARQVIESYDYEARIEAIAAAGAETERHITSLRGEICRGIIEDPGTGEIALGIAIAEDLSFTGETVTENGVEYFRLSPGQTLGIYTASGWQFWINGAKKGWFDSRDAMLHVGSIAIEENLRISADWMISSSGGLGIRYLN